MIMVANLEPYLLEQYLWVPPLLTVAVLYVWILAMRRKPHGTPQKIHCRACDFRGFAELRQVRFQGWVQVCPRCASERLVPVREHNPVSH